MPEYLKPGVYIEETERGPRPIEGVSTSTTALIGETRRGPLEPARVTGWTQFRRMFGDCSGDGKHLPCAVRGFFENGGRSCYIGRTVAPASATASAAFGDVMISAIGPGVWGNNLRVRVSDAGPRQTNTGNAPDRGQAGGKQIQVFYWRNPPAFEPDLDAADLARTLKETPPDQTEIFDGITFDAGSPDYWDTRINHGRSCLIELSRVVDGAEPDDIANGYRQLAGGGPDLPADLPEYEQVLARLEDPRYDDIAVINAPNATVEIARRVVNHCEKVRYRFAIIDAAADLADIDSLDPRTAIADSSYAAFYYPRFVVRDPGAGLSMLIPPGGHIAGIYARNDAERGVWKAPANVELRGVIGLEIAIGREQQGILNPRGVNVIREFPRRGRRVWGARTLSSDPLWKYVNVRRLCIFIEKSIERGTRWVVFEPNDEALWARVRGSIRDFLRDLWRAGALAGSKEDEAFHVRVGSETMTSADIENGRLIVEIGLAPVKPAEFIILRVVQHTGDASRHSGGGPGSDRTTGRRDPCGNFLLRLEIDGVQQAAFSEVSGLDVTVNPVVYRNGESTAQQRKHAGKARYGNITLRRGIACTAELHDWFRRVTSGNVVRKDAALILLDDCGKQTARFEIAGAWPTRCDPGDLNAKANEVAIDTLELGNEGISLGE